MKKGFLFLSILGSILIFSANVSRAVTTINLIEALDYYDDDILKLGDGFYSTPSDRDNDAGLYDYQAVFSGTFTVNSSAIDNMFTISLLASGYGDGGGGSSFMLNNNSTPFDLGRSGSSFTFSRIFSDYLQIGTNTITYRVGPDGSSNLDDYFVTKFDLTYNPAPASGGGATVPEPTSVLLFGLGLAGLGGKRVFVGKFQKLNQRNKLS